ncbi:trans-sulfuration enzyme family protein [Gorillibacterium sp. sgz5001074]|uniref:trans-sulfuration enzyme family protein n=1 Tax=Gorillibacterium sp. sgz5001074 TaxID=3446695 RepID=UPI003F66C565
MQSESDIEICTRLEDASGAFYGAVIPPLYGNSLFVFPTVEEYIQARKEEHRHYVYWRGTNPTVEIAERKLAALERGESCKLFASGMAALTAALLGSLRAGDHVVCICHVYEETKKLLHYLNKFGISYTMTSSVSLPDIEAAARPETKLVLLESPTSFTFRLVDLEGVVRLAKDRGFKTIIDNTWATPLYQKPLPAGIDLAVHSVSKYLGGHSDLVGGAVIGSSRELESLFYQEYLLLGAALAPYEAGQLLKGLRTLPLRMEAHRRNALEVAEFLERHPAVARVNHPGLPSHPDYKLALKQMSGTTGLFSFELNEASFETVARVINRLQRFQIGVSWGSFESLVLSPNEGTNEEQLLSEGISPGLIRLSIGLEDTEALIRDLDQALSGA